MGFEIAKKAMEKWDIRFCDLAKYISKWSKDPKAKVGAVLFSKKGGNVTIGYNGFPMGIVDSVVRLDNQEEKLDIVVHAEVNALIAAGERAAGSTLYVYGKPICARCAGPIIQAGVKRVVAREPGDTDSKWDISGKRAHSMFVEAGVEVHFYTEHDEPERKPKDTKERTKSKPVAKKKR